MPIYRKHNNDFLNICFWAMPLLYIFKILQVHDIFGLWASSPLVKAEGTLSRLYYTQQSSMGGLYYSCDRSTNYCLQHFSEIVLLDIISLFAGPKCHDGEKLKLFRFWTMWFQWFFPAISALFCSHYVHVTCLSRLVYSRIGPWGSWTSLVFLQSFRMYTNSFHSNTWYILFRMCYNDWFSKDPGIGDKENTHNE